MARTNFYAAMGRVLELLEGRHETLRFRAKGLSDMVVSETTDDHEGRAFRVMLMGRGSSAHTVSEEILQALLRPYHSRGGTYKVLPREDPWKDLGIT